MKTEQPTTEEQIIESVRSECGSNNWRLGELAAQWVERWAKGRTDAAFCELVGEGYGLSVDRIGRCRRVWIDFGERQPGQQVSLRQKFPDLTWSHFDKARQFPEDLQLIALNWAVDVEANVAEMLAYMREIHGQSLPEAAPAEISTEAPPPAPRQASQKAAAHTSPPSRSAAKAIHAELEEPATSSRVAPAEEIPDAHELPAVSRDADDSSPPWKKFKSLTKYAVNTLSLLRGSLNPVWYELTNEQQDTILDEIESLTRGLTITGQRLARRVHKLLFLVTQAMEREWSMLPQSELLHLADPIETLHTKCMTHIRSDGTKPGKKK